MNFKSRINVAANPDIELRVHGHPVEFSLRGGGKLGVTTSPIHADVGSVPVHVAMPFMRGRRVMLATFGPFHFTMKPITFSIHSEDVRVEGKIGGEEGIDGRVDIKGKCRGEIEVMGESAVKAVKAAFEGVFEDEHPEPEPSPTERPRDERPHRGTWR